MCDPEPNAPCVGDTVTAKNQRDSVVTKVSGNICYTMDQDKGIDVFLWKIFMPGGGSILNKQFEWPNKAA